MVFGVALSFCIRVRYHEEYDPIRNGSMDGTDIAPHDHGLQRAYQNHCTPSLPCDEKKIPNMITLK